MSDTTDPRQLAQDLVENWTIATVKHGMNFTDTRHLALARALLTALDDFGSLQAALKASNLARHAAEAEIVRLREALETVAEGTWPEWLGVSVFARRALSASSGSAPAEEES